MLTNMSVFELPPKESFIKCVSLLSRYGMWAFETLPFESPWMTSPRDLRERLIAFDSLKRSILVFGLDLFSLSEPARSTKEILLLEISPFLLFVD